MPCSSSDQPSLELVRSDNFRRIAYCSGVAVEGIDFSTSLFSTDIDVDGSIGTAMFNAMIICKKIPRRFNFL